MNDLIADMANGGNAPKPGKNIPAGSGVPQTSLGI
jgi:hypothetical protein